MQGFKKLLVAVVAEMQAQPALRRVAQLAQRHDAELDVIAVMQETPHYAGLLGQRLHADEAVATLKRESARYLERLIAPLTATGLQVNIRVATGTLSLAVIRAMLRRRHDLVVKTIEPERSWKQILLGSTDLHLLRKCPRALWLMQPAEPARYRRILVAIDLDMEDQVKRELATRLLHIATSLARCEGAELLIVHAWTLLAEKKCQDVLTTTEFNSHLRSSRQESHCRLQTFLSTVGVSIPPHRVHLARGKASVVIPRLARRHAVDLVVMGTLGRSGIPGLLMGSTVERLLNQLACSILIIKLPGSIPSVPP